MGIDYDKEQGKWVNDKVVADGRVKMSDVVADNLKKIRNVQLNEEANDPVNSPRHYTSHPSGIECIVVTRHFNFNLGNVIKYIWRAGLKDEDATLEDLLKAKWYLEDEIERRRNEGET